MSSTRGNESSQGDGGAPPPPPTSSAPEPVPAAAPPEHSFSRAENKVFKSGPLFLSSKGIGWTSWKKRWFILTRTSLVFFRSDPNAVPPKGSEVNLILGGIDLNNSGSVVLKADKKLLTVLFPDGRDGRTFTLKWDLLLVQEYFTFHGLACGEHFIKSCAVSVIGPAETMDDLYEWKAALESALSEAPSAALVKGQNGILKSDQTDGSEEQSKEKQSSLSMVIGRPVLLALEEVDGSPSFLEKALRFVEEHGIKVEGILRQAAAVDDVEHRIREYEQGKNEFSPHEDAHVIADCIKYVLRELPSSPVPASCCNALLEACRTNHENRVQAMRTAICETFPEPNRRLLQRILLMMQAIASHKAENRMSSSAVAACMAPLLLRPLLAGDCELENDFDLGGDGSAQLLQAAAAANHAQAIVITLLEEYDNIFGEATLSPGLYSEAEDSGSESEEATDDDESYEDDEREYSQDSEMETDETESISSESHSGSSDIGPCDESVSDEPSIHSPSAEVIVDSMEKEKPSSSAPEELLPQSDRSGKNDNVANNKSDSSQEQKNDFSEVSADHSAEIIWVQEPFDHSWSSSMKKSTTIATRTVRSARRPAWGRTPGKKNLSMENIDIGIDDEDEIQRLEVTRNELQDKVAEEAKKKAVLQGGLEREKKALHERRLALQQEVARLQEQLQKERDLRRALEAGLAAPQVPLPIPASVDEKTKKDLEELALARADISNLKQKVDDLGVQLNKQHEENNHPLDDLGKQQQKSEDNHLNLVNPQSDARSTANLYIAERSTSSKDSKVEVTETASERNQESTSSLSKTQSSSHHLDSLNSKSRCSGLPPADPVSGRHNALSKRSTSRGEGTNTTASALTKLTTRLNFLKERRTQIANELQHMDKSGSSGQVLEKGKTSEVQSLQRMRRGTESDSGKPAQNYDDQSGPEDDSKNPDTLWKSDSQHVGRGKKSHGRTSPNLDRAR